MSASRSSLRGLLGRFARALGLGAAIAGVRRSRSARRQRLAEERRLRESAFSGVTVIIPTYRPNRYLAGAVRSALRQTLPSDMLDVIVSVNGRDERFARYLTRRYALNKRVLVVYTPTPGLSSGRNYALNFVTHDLLTYLDDDDYFTRNYLRPMLLEMNPKIELVCGRVEDEKDGVREASTYLTRAIRLLPRLRRTKDYARAASLLTTAWGKVYRTEFMREHYIRFDESVTHTEDVLFWAENIHNLTLPICAVSADTREALVRRVTEDSMSRPSEERAYEFWVRGRLDVLERLEAVLFHPERTSLQKGFVLVKFDAQMRHLTRYVRELTGERRDAALQEVASRRLQFLNMSDLADRRGIAFCHNFAPYQDASAYVAAKRLPEIAHLAGAPIEWTVVTGDMSGMRAKDATFGRFFARRQYSDLIQIPGRAYFNPLAQHRWADAAVEAVADKYEGVSYIYSRSMFAGSHEAAFRFKQAHPEVTWYAEFSDPIYLDTSGEVRPVAPEFAGGDAWLNDYWRVVEDWVFKAADEVIFTNPNQLDVMVGRLAEPVATAVRARSRVMAHPILDPRWADVLPTKYLVDSDYINVGYFGTFYADRKADRLLELLRHPRVRLHLFVPDPSTVGLESDERIRINSAVDHLNFLNIGRSMDYLVLNDLSYSGPINPYVPSKLADYLATGSSVIAFTYPGTILSQIHHPRILKVAEHERPLMVEGGLDFSAALLPGLKEGFAPDMSVKKSAQLLLEGTLTTGFSDLPQPDFDVVNAPDEIWWASAGQHSNTYSLYLLGLRPVYLASRAAVLEGREDFLDLADALVQSFYRHSVAATVADMFDNDHAIAERIENLTYFVYAAVAAGRKPAGFACVRTLVEQDAVRLLDDRIYQRNHNHGIIADRAVLLAAIMLGESEHQDWITRAVERLKDQVATAYGDDGVHAENSVDYHRTITTMLASCVDVLTLIGNDYALELSATIAKAGEYFAYALKPDGLAPLIGDTKGSDRSPAAAFLAVLPECSSEVEYLLTQGASGQPPQSLFRRFSSGYVFMRETVDLEAFRDSTWISLQAGYSTRTHKQRDDLSIGLYSKGHDIFVDSGMAGYLHHDPMTKYMASVGAHTTTSVDDIEYSLARANGRKFRIVAARQGQQWDYAAASSHVIDGVAVYRHLYYLRQLDVLVINDQLHSAEPHTFRQHFKLSPDVMPTESTFDRVTLSIADTEHVVTMRQVGTVADLATSTGAEGHPKSFMSTGFGSTRPTTTLTYSASGSEVDFVTVIAIGAASGETIDATLEGRIVHVGNVAIPLVDIDPPQFHGATVVPAGDSIRVGHMHGAGSDEFAVYLTRESTGEIVSRSDYTADTEQTVAVPDADRFLLMYFVRNAYSEVTQGIVASIERSTEGDLAICTFDRLVTPRVLSATYRKVEGVEYEFALDVDYGYPVTARWWVYRDGVNQFHEPAGGTTQRHTLDKPGDYVVIWSLNDARFGEFAFDQFPVITVNEG